MKNKKIRIFASVVLLLFLFVQVADAWLPAAIALGIALRTAGGAIIAHLVREQVAYQLLSASLLTVGYLYATYDRGTGVDSTKRYVNVPLTQSKAVAGELKAKVIAANPNLTDITWAPSVSWDSLPTATGFIQHFFPVPSNTYYCVQACTTCSYPPVWSPVVSFVNTTVVHAIRDNNVTTYQYLGAVCSSAQRLNYADSAVAEKIYSDAELRHYYQEALGRDLSKGGIVESASPASNTTIFEMGGDVYEAGNYTDARSYIENGIASETPVADSAPAAVAEKSAPPTSNGSCGDYQYKNNWVTIKADISSAINTLPLYGLINKLADLTGQSGFPHQYTLDLSSVGLGRPSLDLDVWHFLEVLAVLRWAVLAGSFILAWRIAVGGA